MIKHQNLWRFVTGCCVLVSSACDVDVTNCNKSDAAICEFDEDDFDSSVSEDGGNDDDDASTTSDGGVRSDAGGDAASSDAGGDAAIAEDAEVPSEYSLEEFCAAQVDSAKAWQFALGEACPNSADLVDVNAFLLNVFALRDESIGDCVSARQGSIDRGAVAYHKDEAPACAAAFSSQFAEPPASFPTTGIDVGTYEGSIGHGVAGLPQIPACRAAFEGKIVRDAVCADSVECVSGLRCQPGPGGDRTCQPARDGGICVRGTDCIDTYRCVGSDSSGRTCVSVDDLPIAGGCKISAECSEGYVCSDAGNCTPSTAALICAP